MTRFRLLLFAVTGVIVIVALAILLTTTLESTPNLIVELQANTSPPTEAQLAKLAKINRSLKAHLAQQEHTTYTDTNSPALPHSHNHQTIHEHTHTSVGSDSMNHNHDDSVDVEAIAAKLQSIYSYAMSELRELNPEKADEMDIILSDVRDYVESLSHEEIANIDVKAVGQQFGIDID